MKTFQDDYLFLVRHDVKTIAEVIVVVDGMTDKKIETSKEKSRIYKERARFKNLFGIMSEMLELQSCENCYQRGKDIFEKEHIRWSELKEKISKEGYSISQLMELKQHFTKEIALIREKEKAVAKEERIARRIVEELSESHNERKEKQKHKCKNIEKTKRPTQ